MATTSEIFDIFTLPFIGSPLSQDPLGDLNSIALSRKLAEQFFPGEDPVGQELEGLINNTEELFTVSAVYEDLPRNSTFRAGCMVNGRWTLAPLNATFGTSDMDLRWDFNFHSTWNFSNFNHSVTGGCPNGSDATGSLVINQTGDSFTLEFTNGMTCSPASMCLFSGTVSGAEYTGSNTAVVDNEGGVATNTFIFTASSASEAAGHTVSTYVHPQMSCEWNFDVTLTKAGGVPDGGQTDGGSIGGDDGSSGADMPTGPDDDGGCSTSGNPASGLAWLALGLVGLIRRRHA